MVNASKCISKFAKNHKNETKIEIINNDTLSSNKLTPGEVSIIKWMQYQTHQYQNHIIIIICIIIRSICEYIMFRNHRNGQIMSISFGCYYKKINQKFRNISVHLNINHNESK
eukprot:125289_1